MPGEPKRKHSKARKRTRRAAITLKNLKTVVCSNCKKMKLPHQVCKYCGFYNGKWTSAKTKAQVIRA